MSVLAFGWFLVTDFKYQAGGFLQRIGPVVTLTQTFEAVRAYRFPVTHWLGFAEGMQLVSLDIKQEDFRTLEYAAQNDTKIREGLSDGDEIRHDIFVKANLRINDETVPVNIRLKGDRRIHWGEPENWSLRVEVRGDQTVFGLKEFSLQKPVTRNYLYEWFYHQVLKREGLIGLRYDFINLTVNGRSQGVYAIEEHFDKLLLESNDRREAPILKFDEAGSDGSDWYRMVVTPFGKKRWVKRNPELMQKAVNLLEDFQYGRLTVGQVFDVELLARYFALIDLMEMFHGGLAKSVRFYYNPINEKFEPIGFDGHFNDRKFPVFVSELSDFREPGGYGTSAYYNALFGPDIHNKLEFYEAYVRELERISQPEFLDELFAELDAEIDEKLDQIYAETPWKDALTGHPLTTGVTFLFYFSRDKFYERQQFIRTHLYPEAAVTAYIESADAQKIVLWIANAQKLPMEIKEVAHAGMLYRPEQRLLLNEKPRFEPMAFERYVLPVAGVRPPAPELKKSESRVTPKRLESVISYSVPGASQTRERELYDWAPSFVNDKVTAPYNRFAAFEPRRFLELDEEKRTITIQPGYWEISRDIIIPAGFTLIGLPETTLDMLKGSRLVSYSPLMINGTEMDPFVMTSGDDSGKGLVVLEAAEKSVLRHARFERMTLSEDEFWKLTSAVTFHRSDVSIEDCFFGDNQSEDALNIVRSNFTISNSRFGNTFSDAFDSDFSNGRVDDTVFRAIGNDAIDVSGTEIVVRQVQVYGAGDKGLSVGEGSRLDAEFVTIEQANIGVAVKDNSNFDAMTLTIRNSNVGFALFQKKPEYGPATASIWRALLTDVTDTHWLEEGSSLSWDGMPVEPNRTGLKKVLYPDEFVTDEKPSASQAGQ